jgi:hypothetical protein
VEGAPDNQFLVVQNLRLGPMAIVVVAHLAPNRRVAAQELEQQLVRFGPSRGRRTVRHVQQFVSGHTPDHNGAGVVHPLFEIALMSARQ